MHTSHTVLANVDLTNRCNLTCPVCFANANAAGYLYEPELGAGPQDAQCAARREPVADRIVQFSGGEPTIYPHFLEACRMAKEMGFSHVQCATNGIMFTDLEFAHAGEGSRPAHAVPAVRRRLRGHLPAHPRRIAATRRNSRCIENVRKAGMKICFVPTVVKGLNDHQIGDIVRLALDNIECVSAISFQPVAFTGRISRNANWKPSASRWRTWRMASRADRHLRTLRGLVPALLRGAVLEVHRRAARRGDPDADPTPALLHGHLHVRG